MTTYNFETATAVKYASRDITKVYLGSVMIWPIHHSVPGDLNAKGSNITDNILDAETNGFITGSLVELTIPHDVTDLSISTDSTKLMDLLTYRDLIFSSGWDRTDFYGHNKYQSDSEGDSYGANGRAMQARYGGTWIFPGTAKAGDEIYLTLIDWTGNGVSVAHVTFT